MSNYGYNSESWWPPIQELAARFLSWVNEHSTDKLVSLELRDLEDVKRAYANNLDAFKKWFYGSSASDNSEEEPHNLDRHKICALYIQSFLEISPFYIKNHQNREVSKKTLMYPNEYFCLELMELIFMAWNKTECAFNMDENEKTWFIGLLNHFRLDSGTLDVLSLSQVIYYIEKQYLNTAKKG